MQIESDVIIIGGGAAGLSLALRLADCNHISLITKVFLEESSTYYAQGGIAAVLDDADSAESHSQDTQIAGAGLCHPEVVQYVVNHGKENIDWLISLGVPFTRDQDSLDGHYHLTREGGHQHRRVIHAADATGRAVETTLASRVRRHPNIKIYEQHIAIDLITASKLGKNTQQCLGVYVLDRRSNHVRVFRAAATVLATGGASKVYLYSTNPDTASGDGIAIAWRAGCRVANLEFNQFHPTCLYHPHAKAFLLTEALRGEGAKLRLPDGKEFMQRFDPRGELASRDVVARAIDHEMKRLGSEHLLLDISHQPAEFITNHFPTIYARCLQFGYDLTKQPIPVVPAAHYTCGGVITDKHGQTDIPGLYAIGEVAHTGLHGANRLASNSLLECLVYAQAASEHIARSKRQPVSHPLPEWDESRVTDSDEEVVVTHNWDELRRFMWDYVGIVRTTKRLERAQRRVNLLLQEIDDYYGNFRVTNDLLELRNLAVCAHLMIQSALRRKESRGLHYTLDYPHTDNSKPPQDTILTPPSYTPVADLCTV
ncbi:MAG: L-aspartate oxidase [Gammaproteobacteria bacterium]|nr:L-aspartate oxidase [Gammaproteobacteria bacterium]